MQTSMNQPNHRVIIWQDYRIGQKILSRIHCIEELVVGGLTLNKGDVFSNIKTILYSIDDVFFMVENWTEFQKLSQLIFD